MTAPSPGQARRHKDDLCDLAAAREGITLEEIKAALLAERGLTVSAIWAMVRKLGLRHKKSRSGLRSRIAPTSPCAAGAGTYGSASWIKPPLCFPPKPARRPT